MGGPHATLLPYQAAAHVDIVAVGEAESLWPLVLRDVAREARYPQRKWMNRGSK